MNFSKKALLVLVMGSLVYGSKVQASEDAWKVLAPLAGPAAVAVVTPRLINADNSAFVNDAIKALAIVGLSAGHHLTHQDGSLNGFVKNSARIGLAFASYLIATNKNVTEAVSKLPMGIDKLLSDQSGIAGNFGKYALFILVYKTLEKAGQKSGIIDQDAPARQR